ncbi:hypothetical protein [Microbacterium sp. NPDC089188]|uniref:hypothetical protein n=1 Tax=Microbacterium sp. NPDC089188 TaxID=3154971 RepID=UPI003427EA81
MTDLIPLFGGHTTVTGQHLTGGLARQARRQEAEISLQANGHVLKEQAEAFVAKNVIDLIAGMVRQAEFHMRDAGAGREMYENAIYGYSVGAARRAAGR